MHAAAGPRDVRVPAIIHDRHAVLVYHNEPSRRGRRRDCCMDVNRSTRSGIGSPTACGRQNVDAVRLVPECMMIEHDDVSSGSEVVCVLINVGLI